MYDSLYGFEEIDIFNIEDFRISLRPPILDTDNEDYNIFVSLINEITKVKILDNVPASGNEFVISSSTLKSIKKGIYFLDIYFINKLSSRKYTDRTRLTLKGD